MPSGFKRFFSRKPRDRGRQEEQENRGESSRNETSRERLERLRRASTMNLRTVTDNSQGASDSHVSGSELGRPSTNSRDSANNPGTSSQGTERRRQQWRPQMAQEQMRILDQIEQWRPQMTQEQMRILDQIEQRIYEQRPQTVQERILMNDRIQSIRPDIPTVQSQADSGDTSGTSNKRERTEPEKVLKTPVWKSEKVQNLYTQLKQEIPGTERWNKKSSEILVEYEDQIEELNERAKDRNKDKAEAEHEYKEEKLLGEMNTLYNMLKPGGSIYIEREREISAKQRKN
jgi:hypothetical protein